MVRRLFGLVKLQFPDSSGNGYVAKEWNLVAKVEKLEGYLSTAVPETSAPQTPASISSPLKQQSAESAVRVSDAVSGITAAGVNRLVGKMKKSLQ